MWLSLLDDTQEPTFTTDSSELRSLLHSYLGVRTKLIRAESMQQTMSTKLNRAFQEFTAMVDRFRNLQIDYADARNALPEDWEPARIRNERDSAAAQKIVDIVKTPGLAQAMVDATGGTIVQTYTDEELRELECPPDPALVDQALALDPTLTEPGANCQGVCDVCDPPATAPQAVANGGETYPVVGDMPAELSPHDGA